MEKSSITGLGRLEKYLLLSFLVGMMVLNLFRLKDYTPQAHQPLDLRQLYAGQLLLEQGENPYQDSALKKIWTEKVPEAKDLPLPGAPENYLLYPPHALLICSWLLPEDWQNSRSIAWALALLSLLVIPFVAQAKPKRAEVVIGFMLVAAFGGSLTALILAQPALPVIVFLLLALNTREKQPLLAGVFLFLSFFKPSLALPLLMFFIAEKRFRMLLTAFGISLLFYGLLWLQTGNELWSWIDSWLGAMRTQTAVVFEEGHAFLLGNMTGLEALLFQLSGWKGSGWILLFSGLLYGGLMYFLVQKKLTETLALELFLLLGFLFFYHLYYDLLLLLVLVLLRHPQNRGVRWLVLALILPLGYLGQGINLAPLLLLILFVLKLIEFSSYAREKAGRI
ncbi:MAG: DUF2029 domain-containing protein [Bacteroidota bacterium]|nr:DUF2029 domain-containing protein [Bacteroidota bacterium]MDX5430146.1 DUF2029 domain-containing protein [Bacteroidota bacterium]MDX5468907.1 DUF2029 domain-containing protein [Bacteroidota bacterium]